jgi:ABC-2 type transport system ATP-binding protein
MDVPQVPEPITVIKIEDVSKRFIIRKDKSLKERIVNFGRSRRFNEDFWALQGVDLDITAGSTVGLIGPNGSGKSTLLKAIGGIIQPTSGSVRRRGRLAALLELGAGFHPDLTGRENVHLNAAILGLSSAEIKERFDDIVEFSGIEPFIDTQVKFYSSGMYVRLAFAIAVHVDPDVLLVDEVLAVGDEPFQRKCMDKIRSFQHAGKTIVLVTHSLEVVGDLCDRAVVLNHGKVVFDGDPAGGIRALREGFEERERTALNQRFGSGSGPRIVGSRLVDAATGRPTEYISPGDSLRFEVDVDTDVPMDDWVVGMGIDTPGGQVVFGTNTMMLGAGDETLDGPKRVVFELPDLQLGTGHYLLHASFGTSEQNTMIHVSDAARLEVYQERRSVGQVAIDVSYEVS